jgi:excisionase family DNA binding protein
MLEARRELLTVPEVAEMLAVPVGTLYAWRHKGTGPRALKVGRHLRYRAADVGEWLDSLAAKDRAVARVAGGR